VTFSGSNSVTLRIGWQARAAGAALGESQSPLAGIDRDARGQRSEGRVAIGRPDAELVIRMQFVEYVVAADQ
jgi:hypothetical protein